MDIPQPFSFTEHPISIADYLELLNEQLKLLTVKLIGEVTQIKKGPTGHVYFTLKDKESGAVLDCILWKSTYQMYGVHLVPGLEIMLTGNANVYPASGRLSFIGKSVELVGEGALKRAYEEVKRKLSADGLLAEERKRAISAFPVRIGILTSKSGAVIHDFTNNLRLHGFQIIFRDTRVEGSEAVRDLLSGIKQMGKEALDVLVVMRGGGSLQSLAAFDTEAVVRAVANFPVPVVAAIGHHQDVPLTALVADQMVSTPTAAAHLLSSSWDQAATTLQAHELTLLTKFLLTLQQTQDSLSTTQQTILERFNRILSIFEYAKEQIATFLLYTSRQLPRLKIDIDALASDILVAFETESSKFRNEVAQLWFHHITKPYTFTFQQGRAELENIEKLISLHNPLRLLHQGYSIVRDTQGKVVSSVTKIAISEQVGIMLADGTLTTTVTQKEVKKHE